MRRSRRQRGGFCSSPFSFSETCEQANARKAAEGPSKPWLSNPFAAAIPVQQQQEEPLIQEETPFELNAPQVSSYNDTVEERQRLMGKQMGATEEMYGGRRRRRMSRGGSVNPFNGVYSSHAPFKGGRRTRKTRKTKKSKKTRKSKKSKKSRKSKK